MREHPALERRRNRLAPLRRMCMCLVKRISIVSGSYQTNARTNGYREGKKTQACEDVLDQERPASSHQSSALCVILIVVRRPGESASR